MGESVCVQGGTALGKTQAALLVSVGHSCLPAWALTCAWAHVPCHLKSVMKTLFRPTSGFCVRVHVRL
jgi:hypothetical protein